MSHQMTKDDASRIQSTQGTGGHYTGAGSFAACAQSAGDRNANQSSGNSSKSK
ncbi:hypothetical protein VTJ49DRAFT_1292 [Mycothermus thermophilus]|uniref:SMP domain-containing protein n=1 Tax=Humicola insolens TaxID=85995 RepID=A0ABR3VD01_HUMIN